jgi:uridine kinase
VIEGLHPFYDERVRDLLDFKIYLDISDDVKFAWKLQVQFIIHKMLQDALQAVWLCLGL